MKDMKVPTGSSALGNILKVVAGKYVLDKMQGQNQGTGGGRAPKTAEDWENEEIAKRNDHARRQEVMKDVLTASDERKHVTSIDSRADGGIKITAVSRMPRATAARKPATGGTRKSRQLENVAPKDNTATASSGKSTSAPAAKPKKGYSPGPKF